MYTTIVDTKIMLLTGCASGIGAHLTGALSARGHKVLATDLREEALAAQARERGWDASRVGTAALDVRDEAAWEAALDRAEAAFGPVDVVMNIAGYLRPAWVPDIRREDVDLHIDVNVKGTILGTRAAARRMVRRGSGHVVNFGSLASLAATPGLPLYAASKFAVRGFSIAAATELAPKGVRLTLIMPDAVETPMLDLQVGHEEAALTFSGSRALTVHDIERLVVETVLPKQPLEVTIPPTRGGLARVANAAPGLAQWMAPLLQRKGRAAQKKRGG